MDTAVVTFTQHYTDVVNTKYGTKTKNTFVTDDGQRFESWKSDVAARVAAGLNAPQTILFEEKVSGQYTNLEIKEVLGGSVSPPAPTVVSNGAPTVEVNRQSETPDERNVRIMRQTAAKIAVQAFASEDLQPVTNTQAVMELAEEWVEYFTNGLRVRAEA